MAKIKPPSRDQIRIPQGWNGQDRELVIQLNNKLNNIVLVLTAVVKKLNDAEEEEG